MKQHQQSQIRIDTTPDWLPGVAFLIKIVLGTAFGWLFLWAALGGAALLEQLILGGN